MPTRNLVIAAGGTGTRMARQLVNQWPSSQGVPETVQIVVIDARSNPEVELTTNYEMVTVPEPLDYPQAFERLSERDDEILEAWWPSEVGPDNKITFTSGCGAKRWNGRFFCAQFGGRIADAIRNGVSNLFDATVAPEGTEPELNTYVLASLGNGTGGGTFLPLAIMAKSIVREQGYLPRTYGMFIPSTVTSSGRRGVSDPITSPRVMANGVASLIELQYEQNRGFYSSDRELFIEQPEETAAVQTPRERFDLLNDESSPFDSIYLFDRQNQAGQHRSYDELVSIGGRSLHSLLTGADKSKRILDQQVNAYGSFGSMGYARMKSPVDEAIEYTTMRLLTDEAADRFQPDTSRTDREHAELELTFGDERCEDSTIDGSTDFFIDVMAQIREVDTSDPFFNHLRERVDSPAPEFNRHPETVDEFQDAKRWIHQQVTTHKAAAEGAADTILEGDTSDLPEHLDTFPEPATFDQLSSQDKKRVLRARGVRWMLAQRVVTPLVGAGKFGVLTDWLETFKDKIEESRNSVGRVELAEVEHVADFEFSAELNDLLDELQRKSESWMSLFESQRAEQVLANKIRGKLGQFYRDCKLRGEVDAVRDFYDDLEGVVDQFRQVARRLGSLLHESATDRQYVDRLEEQQRFFANSAEQSQTGDLVVLHVGGEEDVDRIADQLREGRQASIHGIEAAMDGLSEANKDLFARAADGLSFSLPGFEAGETDRLSAEAPTEQLASDYIENLEGEIRDASMEFVVGEMNLRELLENRAEEIVDEFVEVTLPAMNEDTFRYNREAKEADRAFNEMVGDNTYRTLLDRFDRADRPEDIRKEAVKEGIEADLQTLANLATSNWNPSRVADDERISSRTMFLYQSSGGDSLLEGAFEELEVVAESHRTFPADRIDCVSVELGGRLKHLQQRLVDEHTYRECLNSDSHLADNFTPHIETEYIEAGEKYLRWRESGGEGERSGALYVALATFSTDRQPQLFDYLVHSGSGNYEFKRDVKVDNEVFANRGKSVPPSGSGVSRLISWLDGELAPAERGRDLAEGLRQALKRDLMSWTGTAGTSGVSGIEVDEWSVVKEELSSYLRELEDDLSSTKRRKGRERALEAQIRQLDSVIDDLERTEGEDVPLLLRH